MDEIPTIIPSEWSQAIITGLITILLAFAVVLMRELLVKWNKKRRERKHRRIWHHNYKEYLRKTN